MLQRDRQTVGVILTLVGQQDTSVAAHQPGTDSAAVSVRIGGALIYLHDARTVASVVGQWEKLAGEAAKLPRDFNRHEVAPVRGMKEPAVVIDAADSPPMSGAIVRPRGRASYLRVQLGRVVFDVRDVLAFGSTMVALREAQTLARTTFRGAVDPARRRQALASAAQAFPPPRSTTGRDRSNGVRRDVRSVPAARSAVPGLTEGATR